MFIKHKLRAIVFFSTLFNVWCYSITSLWIYISHSSHYHEYFPHVKDGNVDPMLNFTLNVQIYFCNILGVILDKGNFKQEAAVQVAIRRINQKRYPFQFNSLVKKIDSNNPFQAMKVTCQLLEESIVGVLGPLTEDNSNMVQSILDLKEVPHIEVRKFSSIFDDKWNLNVLFYGSNKILKIAYEPYHQSET